MLDLFKLHISEEDVFPYSWICAGGKNLYPVLNRIVEEIVKERAISKWKLSEIISKKLNYELSCVGSCLYGYKNFIPLILIQTVVKIWEKTFNTSSEAIKENLLKSIEYLKLNNGIATKIKAVKEITEELAKIVGAHAADGTLACRIEFYSESKDLLESFKKKEFPSSLNKVFFDKERRVYRFGFNVNDIEKKKIIKRVRNNKLIIERKIQIKYEYRIKIIDQHKESVTKCSEWFLKCFGKRLKLKKLKRNNAFEISFKDKIIARYFNVFFEFPFGRRSRIIKEPKIIKNSSFNIRKAFAIGVMTFDGCASITGRIFLQSMSKHLCECIEEIMRLEKLKVKKRKDKVGRWCIEVEAPKNLKEAFLMASFFEKNSIKRIRVELSVVKKFEKRVRSENELLNILESIYSFDANRKIGIKDLFLASKKLKKFDIPTITSFLIKRKKLNGLNEWNVQLYLQILHKANVIEESFEKVVFIRKCNQKLKGTKGAVFKRIYTFNPKVSSWKIPKLNKLKVIV
jgi:hypothetical protein